MTQQITQPNRLVWFDIPATDFERAVTFYETILALQMRRWPAGELQMAVFPYERPAVSGCVVHGPGATPGANGVVAYLNAEPALDTILERVVAAGGHIVQPRTELPPGMGVFAKICDTEGNTVGLHALA